MRDRTCVDCLGDFVLQQFSGAMFFTTFCFSEPPNHLKEMSQSKPSELTTRFSPFIAQTKKPNPLTLGLFQLLSAQAMISRNQNGAKSGKFDHF